MDDVISKYSGSIDSEWQRFLESSDLWREYEDILLEVARRPDKKETPAAQLSPSSVPPGDLQRAAVRRDWMDKRHPGWSSVEWSKHTRNAYKTIKKYRDGITTNRTPSIRADIAAAEKVAFSTVPE
jgi:hypothetical protein